MNAGQTPLRFIANIISYSAGKVNNLIKRKHTLLTAASLFYFPFYDEPFETQEEQNAYDQGLQLLLTMLLELQTFYKKYCFFYNQYKHGLCVAFRPYNDYSEKLIQEHKDEYRESANLNVFDNLCITKIEVDDIRVNKKIMMPYLTPDIMEHLPQLMKEDNLLRFITPEQKVELSALKAIVTTSRKCTAIFANNLLNVLKGDFPLNLRVPLKQHNHHLQFGFPKTAIENAGNKELFLLG